MVNINICEGNPGALTFLMEAYEINMGKAERAFQRMQDHGIKGAQLYMLWNDCCDRDTEKSIDIILNESISNIVDHINYRNGRGIPFDEEDKV